MSTDGTAESDNSSTPDVLYYLGHVSPPSKEADENHATYGGGDQHELSATDFRSYCQQISEARGKGNLFVTDTDHIEASVNGRISMFFVSEDGTLGCIGYVTEPSAIEAIMRGQKEGLSTSVYHVPQNGGYTRHLVRVSMVEDPWHAKGNTYIKAYSDEPLHILNHFKNDYLPRAQYVAPGDRDAVERMPSYRPLDPKSKNLDDRTRGAFLFPRQTGRTRGTVVYTRRSAGSQDEELTPEEAEIRIRETNMSVPASTTAAAATPTPDANAATPPAAPTQEQPAQEQTAAVPATPAPQQQQQQQSGGGGATSDLGARAAPAKRQATQAPEGGENTAKAAKTNDGNAAAASLSPEMVQRLLADQEQLNQFAALKKKHAELSEMTMDDFFNFAKQGREAEHKKRLEQEEASNAAIRTQYANIWNETWDAKLKDPKVDGRQLLVELAKASADKTKADQLAAEEQKKAEAAKSTSAAAMIARAFGNTYGYTNFAPPPAATVNSSATSPATAAPASIPQGAHGSGAAMTVPVGENPLDIPEAALGQMTITTDCDRLVREWPVVRKVNSSASGSSTEVAVLPPAMQAAIQSTLERMDVFAALPDPQVYERFGVKSPCSKEYIAEACDRMARAYGTHLVSNDFSVVRQEHRSLFENVMEKHKQRAEQRAARGY